MVPIDGWIFYTYTKLSNYLGCHFISDDNFFLFFFSQITDNNNDKHKNWNTILPSLLLLSHNATTNAYPL